MSVEKIVVSDTNIFLDLISVDLLESFFEFPCEIHTSDFVLGEIKQQKQIKAIQKFEASKKLKVAKFKSPEISEIFELKQGHETKVSFTDCSVWYYAKKINARLITGDGKLRKAAEKDNVLVSGILYIFDNLVEYGVLDRTQAAKKLAQLVEINPRLPYGECQKRICDWQK